eukprot:NODE_8929_length_361_cov_398.575163.p1 GENE.NODE_8929_length_361_cov_398.575163~~NODE_8929_length_361_cov_398.575163.p1  ORF type:complete len:62 (+),score=5.48 NODE_8929_length_361_cov_398.575163:155-340(+)
MPSSFAPSRTSTPKLLFDRLGQLNRRLPAFIVASHDHELVAYFAAHQHEAVADWHRGSRLG